MIGSKLLLKLNGRVGMVCTPSALKRFKAGPSGLPGSSKSSAWLQRDKGDQFVIILSYLSNPVILSDVPR